MGSKFEILKQEQHALTPLQRMLEVVGQFKENVPQTDVLSAAEKLTIASAETSDDKERLHIGNAIMRLAGIAVNGGNAFKENFADALARGEQKALQKGRLIAPEVSEVIGLLSGLRQPVAA